jgi:hypothetical protein
MLNLEYIHRKRQCMWRMMMMSLKWMVLMGRAKMTTHQAVFVSMVDSSHITLGIYLIFSGMGTNSPGLYSSGVGNCSKKVLNETELALQWEETTRKWKNLTEKKLEDQKVT